VTFDLASLGWDADFADSYARYDRLDHQPARVSRVDRGICSVLTPDGAERASLSGAMLARVARDPVELPCAGDWVAIRVWPDDRATIEAVLPRRTRVVRATAGEQSHGQILAANLDTAAVVEPMDPEPDPARVERLLALAWESGATPLVILTKADLVADPVTVAAQMAEVAPGVRVLPVAAQTGRGLAPLRPLVARGKTPRAARPVRCRQVDIDHALAGTRVMATQANRRTDGRGRHTTTFRALVALPGGGAILDTPGVRAGGPRRPRRRAGPGVHRRRGARRRLPLLGLLAPPGAGLRRARRAGDRGCCRCAGTRAGASCTGNSTGRSGGGTYGWPPRPARSGAVARPPSTRPARETRSLRPRVIP